MAIVNENGIIAVSLPAYQVYQTTNPANGQPWANAAQAQAWQDAQEPVFAARLAQQMTAPPPPPPPPPAYNKLTKRSFQKRFPITADGISTKFDLMTQFLISDSYAASIGVTGAPMHALRSLIIAGKNRLDASPHVDYAVSDAADFTLLMASPSIPALFRLTTQERADILNAPITQAEAYKGEA